MKTQILLSLTAAILATVCISPSANAEPQQVPLVFTGGHELDPRDHGRPVILIAAALGVKDEVFREAFSHVRPAAGGQRPEPEQVRKNKAALMGALGKYGITNDRLDEVSNYYRYRPQAGEMWPTDAAEGYALVEGGKVQKVVVTKGGSGYSSAPGVTVTSVPAFKGKAELAFDKEFKKNGAVKAVQAAP